MFWRKRKKQAQATVTSFEASSATTISASGGTTFTSSTSGPTVVSFSSSTGDLNDPQVQAALRQAGEVLDQLGLAGLPGFDGPTATPVAPVDPDDERYESLQQAAKLYQDGVLSLDEFEAEKRRILGG